MALMLCSDLLDYHVEQSSYGRGVIDSLYGGRPGDPDYTWGLWDGLSPAAFPTGHDYGSRVSKN